MASERSLGLLPPPTTVVCCSTLYCRVWARGAQQGRFGWRVHNGSALLQVQGSFLTSDSTPLRCAACMLSFGKQTDKAAQWPMHNSTSTTSWQAGLRRARIFIAPTCHMLRACCLKILNLKYRISHKFD
jgi:hypothetical protein